MPIEPSVFICYGRPDKTLAHAIAKGLWHERIESYNYLAKPIEDRIGKEQDYLAYVYSAKIFIAITSDSGFFRNAVISEILAARLITSLDSSYKRVYIVTPVVKNRLEKLSPDLKPDIEIDLGGVRDTSDIINRLMNIMSSELLTRCRKAWEINKNLYSDAWAVLDKQYSDLAFKHDAIVPERLLSTVVEGSPSLEYYLLDEIEQISEPSHQWSFLNCLAEVAFHISSGPALSLQSAARHMRGLNPEQIMLPRDIGTKLYGANEKITAVSAVLRGAARIVNCLDEGRCQDAFDIAARFTWERSKKVLLVGIYGCSRKLGDDKTAEMILAILGIASEDETHC